MKRFLYVFALLFCHLAFAELNVEWIDDNTIVVTGYGYGDSTNETALGSCTNCLNISPAEMRAIKMDILSNVDIALQDCDTVLQYSSYIQDICNGELSGISQFQRFSSNPHTAALWQPITNYLATVENVQTSLVKNEFPNWASLKIPNNVAIVPRVSNYNNGIYDYATQYANPYLNGILGDAEQIERSTLDIKSSLVVISNTVVSITEESCQSCGGDSPTNGTSCTSCPCEEQWDALLDYVRHIDDDQHKRHVQLHDISNRVANLDKSFDSYAKLVSGILYNDSTIVVDDGENSWSNVYRRGYSDLYDYDKSNILQRIELLLFGVSYNTSTNWGDSVESIEDTSDDLEEKFSEAEDTLREQSESLKDDVELIEEKFTTFVNRLNFFGAGHLGEFSVIDPITVFDAYTFDIDSAGFASDLGNLQQVSRTCFQIFYWVSAVLFMIWFWWSFIRFVINHVFTLVKFFNNLLT